MQKIRNAIAREAMFLRRGDTTAKEFIGFTRGILYMTVGGSIVNERTWDQALDIYTIFRKREERMRA